MRRILNLLPVKTGGATHVKIELYYSKGGMNYFSGRPERRGFYVNVTPVSRSQGNGYVSETTSAFSGIKDCVLEQARFNQKMFDAFVVPQSTLDILLSHVLQEN